MLTTSFRDYLEKGAFKIDFERKNECKGVVYLEVMPLKSDDKIILNGDDVNLITQQNPYKIESNHPIVNGTVLNFRPTSGSKTQQTIVRILLVN